ncbi:MAG: tetratricopeptide repeat protein [Nitrospirota bacterium]
MTRRRPSHAPADAATPARPTHPPGPAQERSRSPTGSNRPWHLLAVALILAAVGIAYANSLDAEFQSDDLTFTADATLRLQELSASALGRAVWHRRPVASLTFALNHYWGGDRVIGYHVVNVAIHAATALVLYALLVLIGRLPRVRDRMGPLPAPAALVAALLWAMHPVHTQAVTYVVQRMTSLASLFYVLALIAYLNGRLCGGRRRVLWWAASLGAGALALGSKEIAATLPFAVLLAEVCLFQPDPRAFRRAAVGAALVLVPIGIVAVFAAQDKVGGSFWTQLTAHRSVKEEFTFTEHLLTEGRVIVHYLTLLVFPHPSRLTFDYAFPLSRGWFDPWSTLAGWLTVLGAIGWALARIRRSPVTAFGMLWFFLNLAIESSVIPLDLAYEHRLYLPSMGPAILLAFAGAWAWARWTAPGWRAVQAVAAAAVIVTGAGWTIERNRVWATEFSLWSDTVAKAPANARALGGLAMAYRDRGELARAVDLLREAVRVYPKYHNGYGQLGLALLDGGDLDGALAAFVRAHELDPNDPQDTYHLGVVYQKLGKPDEATRAFQDTIRLKPDDAEAHNNLGALYQDKGRWQDALAEYRIAARLDPALPQAHYGMGRVFERLGQADAAIRAYRAAIQSNPRHLDAHVALAGLYLAGGDKPAAADTFEAALRLAPDVPEGQYQVARLLDELGRHPEALAHYRRFLDLAAPAHARTRAWVEQRIRAISAAPR